MKNAAQEKFILEHLDEMFPIVRASELRLEDEFMQHQPVGWVQERVMKTLTTQIPLGLEDFRHPRVDPSFDNEGNLVFEAGKYPGVGRYAHNWKWLFKDYLPEKHSQMETDTGYDIFCGVYIKELVAKGYSVERAWYEVCNESCKHGHFWDSHGARDYLERTGSRPQGKWADLGNTQKVIMADGDENTFFVVSGSYKDSSQQYSIASKDDLRYSDYTARFTVGLMRMDV